MIRDVDFHIHTEGMTIQDLLARAQKVGLEMLGISDHLNFEFGTLEDIPQNLEVFRRNKKYLENAETLLPVFFGCEVHIMDEWGFNPLTDEIREEFNFDYIIGGLHGLYGPRGSHREIIDLYQTLFLQMAEDRLIEVIVHPYWVPQRAMDENELPMFPSLEMVPERYMREVAQAAVETNTAIEVNSGGIFSNPSLSDTFKEGYKDFLRILDEEGVQFAIGSDAHTLNHIGASRTARDVLESIGVVEEQIWLPRKASCRSAKNVKRET